MTQQPSKNNSVKTENNNFVSTDKEIVTVSKSEPCLHCLKDDWCYRIGALSVCKRDASPAIGWQSTRKKDAEGAYYYAPILEKPVHPAQVRQWIYHDRSGNDLVKVRREDFGDGTKPKFSQNHLSKNGWVANLKGVDRADIPIYRHSFIQEAISNQEIIFVVEGEPCADALVNLGLNATTNIGGSKKWQASDSADLEGAEIIICPDCDEPGMAHALKIAQDFPDAQWLYAFPDSPKWNDLPKSKGLDVCNWISTYNLSKEEILDAIEPRRIKSESKPAPISNQQDTRYSSPEETFSDSDFHCEELYTQKAINALYSDVPWLALDGDLYKWTGTHYEKKGEKAERRRISDWCKSIPVKNKFGKYNFAYATKTHVSNILDWARDQFGIDREECNPPGLNCANGIVRIIWHGAKASYELIPHSPEHKYTYCNGVRFDPSINPEHCDRLLSCLDPAQQQVLVKSLAASLDLATVRKFKGRGCSKALLLQGLGNNGKDSLKVAIELLYGDSLIDAPTTDFMAYDRGSKFPLSKLEGALLAWSSENPSFSAIDSCQSLKRAISGEELAMERKNENERPMKLNTIFFFNINEAPQIKASTEAISSRWAVLKFEKTFKNNADTSKGEIEADSRFRYDPAFMKEQVTPALLNKMLHALTDLAIQGIDYTCTEQALETMQQEGNHLFSFAAEVGLGYQVHGRIYISDLWQMLRDWYIANGTLVISKSDAGKEKTEWYDQAQAKDKNVKGANQVYPRFKELFPKANKQVETIDLNRKGQSFLAGLAITASPASLPLCERVTASLTASLIPNSSEAATIDIRASEAGEAVLEHQPNLKTGVGNSHREISPQIFQLGDRVKVETGLDRPVNYIYGEVFNVSGSQVWVMPDKNQIMSQKKIAGLSETQKRYLTDLQCWQDLVVELV